MNCKHYAEPTLERRPGNALNLEIGTPMPRCLLKRPEHWPETASTLRWLGSGGGLFVFGPCTRQYCPTKDGRPEE